MKTSEQRIYPELRFKGFEDEWKKINLGNLVDIKTGKLDANAMTSNGKYDFYTSGISKYKIDKAAFEGPAITIAGNGATVGYMHYADGKFNAYQRTYVLTKFTESRFFLFNEIYLKLPSKIRKEARTGNIPYIVLNMLVELTLLVPSKKEQQKIGQFFKKLDVLINLNQNKLDKLKDLKKGYLQKMFPGKGETIPELRFKGFYDEWEEIKLSDITNIFDGTHQTPKYQSMGIPFLSVENISNLKTNKYISEQSFKKDFRIKPEKGDVLMTRIGDIGTANVIMQEGPFAYYVSLALLKPKTVDSEFLRFLISSNNTQRQLWKRTLHVAFPKKINKGEIGEVPINSTNHLEQKNIGEFFKKLDNLIDEQSKNIDQLKNLKKGYLQKMFV